MRKIYLSFLFIGILAFTAKSQVMWDNFQDVRKGTYGFINGSFIPYFGNPDQTGNTSITCASYTRNAAETFDVIILDEPMADLSDYVGGSKQMSIDVWSPAAGTTIQITLENSTTALPDNFPAGRHSVYLTTTTVAAAWETLTFTFDNQPDAGVPNTDVDRMVLLFNPNSNTNDTYFWDNLMGPEFANDPCEGAVPNANVLNDFECNQNVSYTFSHSGINFRREPNPDTDGNESPFVARYQRNNGEENDVIIGRFDGALSLNENSTMELDVWDPAGGTTVIVSLQAANGDVILEMQAETTVAAQWETLSFDPSSVFEATNIEQFVILFDPGNFSGLTYYFDNFTVDGGLSINEVEPLAAFNAFPNPVKDVVTFSYNLTQSSDVQVSIQDVTGKTILVENFQGQGAGSQQINLDMSEYNSGIYIYSISTDTNRSTGKLVVTE